MLLNGQTPTGLSSKKCGTVQKSFAIGLNGNRASRYISNCEPSLDDVLHDDVVRIMMMRDGVNDDQLLNLVKIVCNAVPTVKS